MRTTGADQPAHPRSLISTFVVRCRTVTRGTEFQFEPKNHYGFFFLHTLSSIIAFKLEYVLFYQFYTEITTFFDQEKFATAPLLYADIETFGGNWRENDVNTSKMRSKSSYWRHAQESSYSPHVRQHFLAPVGFTEIQVEYARKQWFTGGNTIFPTCAADGADQ